MNKKAQAAMEFLMTYGWAILVVLVAIGALAYFGILNPQRFLPNSCTIAPGLSCDGFRVTTTNVELKVRNGMGKDLSNVSVQVTSCTDATGLTLDDGNQLDLSGGNGLSCSISGSSFRGDLNFSYTADGIAHKAQGQLVAQTE